MNWITEILGLKIFTKKTEKKSIPDGLWKKCDNCQYMLYYPELEKNLFVCDRCNYHMKINARKRIDQILDKDTEYTEISKELCSNDPLRFRDTKKYKDRLSDAKKNTGENDALIVVQGLLKDMNVVLAVFDFEFIGGSMGYVVGQKFVDGIHIAIEKKIPFICFSSSGGARMQEGMVSLMQMAKTGLAIGILGEHRIPYISVITNPTTGGVAASLSGLGDIIIAEPNATFGFAGRRVIEQTVKQQLPSDFQTSEFSLKHGAIDMIVNRKDMKETIYRILSKLHTKEL